MKSRNILILCAGLILLMLFLFAPSTCNGVTYYRGYRGCGKDNSSNTSKRPDDNKHVLFWNLLKF